MNELPSEILLAQIQYQAFSNQRILFTILVTLNYYKNLFNVIYLFEIGLLVFLGSLIQLFMMKKKICLSAYFK